MAMLSAVRYRLYSLGALYALPYAAMLYFCARHGSKPRSVLALLATTALVSLLLAGCTRTWRRFFLAYFPLLIVSIAYASYALVYGIVPGHTLGILLLSATGEEIRGLLTLWPHKWLLLPLVAALAGYLWLAWGLPEWAIFAGRTNFWMRAILVLTLPVTAYAATSTPQVVDGIALNPVAGSVMFFAGSLPRARAEMRGAYVEKLPFHATPVTHEEVHVLIVGESARRGSWSIYGYQRATTPYLERIKDELILLRHVTADANLTALAVPMILTGIAPQELAGRALHGNLLDVAKEGGYTTSWLVNQDIKVSTSIGITPDHLEYPPEMQPDMFGRNVADSELLGPYLRELTRTGSPRFIGMHVMGSHWEYYRRYPPSFQRFGQALRLTPMSIVLRGQSRNQAMVDSYDNSVLYTDWFLEQVIEAARKLSVPVTVTFVPDHGECLSALDEGQAGHGGAQYNAAEFLIPALVWVNDYYRRSHPQQVAALKDNAAKQIRSHDFFYTVADLMGVTWPQAKPERSFASERFVPDTSGAMLVAGVLQTHHP
jgi:glucan phosphoethanolaminetransferase (alkaline phosphatase superfamily)